MSEFDLSDVDQEESGGGGGDASAAKQDEQTALLTAIEDNTSSIGSPTAETATKTNVNDTNANTQLVAANTSRKGLTIHNDSTAILYVNFGSTASATAFTAKIPPDGFYEMPSPIYTGQINGIWSADASGAARITELT